MIDGRYHIYSLAAVFFALAIGIVIGTSFAKSPATESQKATIKRYENWMQILKREIEKTSDEAKTDEKLASNSELFCQAALPVLVENRLAWRNVAIVRTGDNDELAGSVKRAIELAGGQVTSITKISRNFPFDDDGKITSVLSNCGVVVPEGGKIARNKLWSIIAGSLRGEEHSQMLHKLEMAGVAEFTGVYGRFNKMIVLVGGASSPDTDTSDSVDIQLVAQLGSPNVIVAGCEDSGAKVSYIPAWHKTGIATVDNAETAMGQAALVCALGGERARFGTKDGSDRFVPQTLEIK